MKKILLSATLFPVLAGCNSWVQVTDAGEGVQKLTAQEINDCTRIGRSHATTMSRVLLVQRGSARLQEELLRLARNEAGEMGGNAIVPESPIEEGEQTFGVYRCP